MNVRVPLARPDARGRVEGKIAKPRRGRPWCRLAIAGVFGALLAAMSACGTPPAPGPSRAAVRESATADVLDPSVQSLLVSACYPCHSNDRDDPWFAKLAPSSWSTGGARATLNFSEWSRYDTGRRAAAAQAIAAAVKGGTMPPADYTFFNRSARLSDAQQRSITEWANGESTAMVAH